MMNFSGEAEYRDVSAKASVIGAENPHAG